MAPQGDPGASLNSIGARPPNVPSLVPLSPRGSRWQRVADKPPPRARAFTEARPVNQTGLPGSHRGNGLGELTRAPTGSHLPRDVSDDIGYQGGEEKRGIRERDSERETERETAREKGQPLCQAVKHTRPGEPAVRRRCVCGGGCPLSLSEGHDLRVGSCG